MIDTKSNSLFELKKNPKQQRSKATVDAILEAATQLLLDTGYERTNTNKIAERAGVSIGSLYEYFPGKEAIFAEVRRREDTKLYNASENSEPTHTVREMLRQHISIYIDLVRSNIELHEALIREVPQFAISNAEAEILSSYLPKSRNLFIERKQQLNKHRDPHFFTEFIVRVVRGTINEYTLYSPEKLDEKFTEEMLEMLESYLIK